MPAPSTQDAALELAQYLGINSLDPNDGKTPIRPVDLRGLATVMTQAWGRIFKDGPVEMREKPGSGVLNAPTSVTFTVTAGSAVISSMATWASWMAGCTIRISGDTQDNEILSATLLARPYIGTSGSVTATVYGDALTLDATVAKIIAPMMVGSGCLIGEATTRGEFLTRGGYLTSVWDGNTGISGAPVWLPFYAQGQKPIAQYPSIFYVDGFFDPSLDYVQRRIRFSPMPSAMTAISYTQGLNPPRVTVDDILGVGLSETNVAMPMIDGQVEGIFIPIALQLLSRLPTFKNQDAKPEIARQYQQAIRDLQASRGSVRPGRGQYF